MNFQRVIQAPNSQHPKKCYKIIQILGSGSEGEIYKAQVQGCQSSPDVALKIHKTHQSMNPERMNHYKKFIKDLIDLPSSHQIIKVYEWLELEGECILVMELGEQSLTQYLQQKKNLSMMDKNLICLQVLQSIKFLHDQDLMHRDIKPDNFLIVGSNNEVKLIDFGIIREDDKDCEKTEGKGTFQYMAPEISQGNKNYNKKCDIFSLGCVLYKIYTGLDYQDGRQGKQVNFQNIDSIQISGDMKKNFKLMLNQDPNLRPNIQVIIDTLIKNNQDYACHFNILISYLLNKNLSQWSEDFQYFYKKLLPNEQQQLSQKYLEFVESAKKVDNLQEIQQFNSTFSSKFPIQFKQNPQQNTNFASNNNLIIKPSFNPNQKPQFNSPQSFIPQKQNKIETNFLTQKCPTNNQQEIQQAAQINTINTATQQQWSFQNNSTFQPNFQNQNFQNNPKQETQVNQQQQFCQFNQNQFNQNGNFQGQLQSKFLAKRPN